MAEEQRLRSESRPSSWTTGGRATLVPRARPVLRRCSLRSHGFDRLDRNRCSAESRRIEKLTLRGGPGHHLEGRPRLAARLVQLAEASIAIGLHQAEIANSSWSGCAARPVRACLSPAPARNVAMPDIAR
jgi:hypothetical protein